jgi:hypothetical protein
MYIHMYIHIYICIYIYTLTHTHTYLHTYIHTHIYTYIYIRIRRRLLRDVPKRTAARARPRTALGRAWAWHVRAIKGYSKGTQRLLLRVLKGTLRVLSGYVNKDAKQPHVRDAAGTAQQFGAHRSMTFVIRYYISGTHGGQREGPCALLVPLQVRRTRPGSGRTTAAVGSDGSIFARYSACAATTPVPTPVDTNPPTRAPTFAPTRGPNFADPTGKRDAPPIHVLAIAPTLHPYPPVPRCSERAALRYVAWVYSRTTAGVRSVCSALRHAAATAVPRGYCEVHRHRSPSVSEHGAELRSTHSRATAWPFSMRCTLLDAHSRLLTATRGYSQGLHSAGSRSAAAEH